LHRWVQGPGGGLGVTMPAGGQRSVLWLWTIAALGGLSWGIIAVVVASVGPSEFVPHVFHSYHIEHFAAFYLIALLAAAGFPSAQLYQIGSALFLMAVVLATVRLLIPHHRVSDLEDLCSEVVGVAAALGPIALGRIRERLNAAAT
jgi:hypothetical protein